MNKKGFTLTEVLVSFTLITIVSIFLFQIIMVIRKIYIQRSISTQLIVSGSNAENMLNKKILETYNDGHVLKNINRIDDNNYIFKFNNNYTLDLLVNRNDHNITFGGLTSSLPDNVDIKDIKVYSDSTTLVGDSSINNNGMLMFTFIIGSGDSEFTIKLFFPYESSSFVTNVLTSDIEGNEKASLPSGMAIGDTVYVNPVDAVICSDYTAANSYSGVKNRCMKWYIYKNNGDGTYQLLLDHNTTSNVDWKSIAYINIKLNGDTFYWNSRLNTRLMSANEVAEITGNSSWNSSSALKTQTFYFDSKTTTPSNDCKPEDEEHLQDLSGCGYKWLYDKTSTKCTTYGCLSNSPSGTPGIGFWTNTITSNDSGYAWVIDNKGCLLNNAVSDTTSYGIRPVITF